MKRFGYVQRLYFMLNKAFEFCRNLNTKCPAWHESCTKIHMKKLFILLSLSFFVLGVSAQDKKEIVVKDLIEKQQYSFIAEYAFPLNGNSIYLTSGYDLKVSKDSVNSNLPYYGRGYSAPADPTKIGVNFISTGFEYKSEQDKKSGWDISIKPKDAGDIQRLELHVFSNGQASLQVYSLNRQSISYNGYIKETKKK